MITEIKADSSDWKNDVYIAKKINVDLDKEGNEIVIYDRPNVKPYKFNYQTLTTDADITEFGEKS